LLAEDAADDLGAGSGAAHVGQLLVPQGFHDGVEVSRGGERKPAEEDGAVLPPPLLEPGLLGGQPRGELHGLRGRQRLCGCSGVPVLVPVLRGSRSVKGHSLCRGENEREGDAAEGLLLCESGLLHLLWLGKPLWLREPQLLQRPPWLT